MQWTLTFNIPESQTKIDYQSSVLSIGSCFSTMIGGKLSDRKFQVLDNPFGTLFNPISIVHVMEDALLDMPINQAMMLERERLFLHYGMHSDIAAYSKDSLIKLIRKKQQQTKKALQSVSHLLITFGTAWIYESLTDEQIVANCHKQSSGNFKKRLLTKEEILKSVSGFIKILERFNNNIQIVLTVSPVRHTKDGIPENQISKSLLRWVTYELENMYDHVHYFPSYEIMMDELRDYRFYKEDLIHPNEIAEDYIWQRFKKTWIDPKAFPLIDDFEKIRKDLAHKAFNPDSPAHMKFLDNLQKRIESYKGKFDFSKEMDLLRKQLQYRGK
jgi:hypothetical protein